MTWFKVDDGFHSHPKTLTCSLAARGLWVSAGAWAAHHLTEGAVPAGALALLGATQALAEELCASGLWTRTRTGYKFHDWHTYQPTRAQVEADRKANAERQKRYRENKRNGVRNAVTNGATNGTPTRPDPPPKGGEGRRRATPAARADPAPAAHCPQHLTPLPCGPCRSEQIGAQ